MRAGSQLTEVETIAAIALPLTTEDFSFAKVPGKRIVLVAGENDPYCPRDAVSSLARRLGSSARLRLIPHADHFFGGAEKQLSLALVHLIGEHEAG